MRPPVHIRHGIGFGYDADGDFIALGVWAEQYGGCPFDEDIWPSLGGEFCDDVGI